MEPTKPTRDHPTSPWPYRLTWLAFGLMLSLTIARGTMQEFLREPFSVMPGSDPVPRAAGPATSIGLDLLCCIPALLVITRRLLDPSRPLRAPQSFIPMALVSVWMILSTCWAADKFGALVTACHWAAAMAMLWAAVQLVNDWRKLRLVAAVAFGLLPIYTIYGLNYKFIELPELIKNFDENKDKYLAQHGLHEGSFAAEQFAAKIRLGEMFGYETSPNSFGALLSLLLVVSVGLLIQRIRDHRDDLRIAGTLNEKKKPVDPPTVAITLGMMFGLWMMLYTRSRTAFATPVIAVALLLFVWRLKDRLARNASRFYFIGVGIFVLTIAAVIGHGIAHGSLVHSSLTFRWHYWTGSLRIFKQHPLLGVGWSNFGLHYLAARLPKAPEEVKDPHNFIIRFFTELGFVGGILLIMWQLRLWWEITRPAIPALNTTTSAKSSTAPGVLGFIASVGGGGVILSTILGVDFSMGAVELDVLRHLLFIGAMVIASSLAALRSLHSSEPDDRPAPWVLYTMLVGVGAFLIHNLIDFSLFEIGPMMLFAVLTGSALGIRQSAPVETHLSLKSIALLLTGLAAFWFIAAVGWWGPVLQAERAADAADDLIRANRLAQAEPLLQEANRAAWKLNAEYAFRSAIISPPDLARSRIGEAIRENPLATQFYVARAQSELRRPRPDRAIVAGDYATALKLDPYNVPLRLEYAKFLADFGDHPAAVDQYQTTLKINDQLNWDEKKRLSPEQIAEIKNHIETLK